MIIPNDRQATSSYDDDQATPPPYQERVPPSQLLPSDRPTTSVYAPSVSSRSDPPPEREKELPVPPHPAYPDEKFGGKGKEREGECHAQRAIDVFSSMIWGTTSNAPTSPNQASTSRTPAVQAQDPLNPAPAAFTRPTPKNYAYLPFQPMTMLGVSPTLADGFPLIPPPINTEDDASAGKANAEHPFVSHDVTEEDWLKFLADLKIVTTNPNQAQKSFLAKIFHSEPNERDRRKRAVRFIDAWNHYFFQPRRMNIVLARGRRTFSGASNNRHPPGHHRRHSIGDDRGGVADPTQTGGRRHRHRSLSTDSSSSDSSTSSGSSIRSTASEPPEMPVPHPYGPSSDKPFDGGSSKRHGCGGRGGRGRHHHTGAGRCGPGTAGPSTAPPLPNVRSGLEGSEPGLSHDKYAARRELKQAWKVEKRGMKYERRRMKRAARFEKRAVKYERRQRKRELKAARRAEGHTRGDDLWKLLIFFHGARRDTGQS